MAGKIQGLTVVINGDATPLARSIRQAKSEATMLRTHLSSVNQLLKFQPTSAELIAKKQGMLTEAIAQNARTYRTYQTAHEAYSRRLGTLTEAEMTQFRNLEREMTRNRVEFQRLRQDAVSFGAAASAGTLRASATLTSYSQSMRAFSNYALGASVAVGVAGAASLAAAREYEYAFADVRKTIDATEAEYDKLYEAGLKMSLVRPTTPEDIAYIMSLGGQLNVASRYLEKFAGTTADLDVATNMNLEDASIDLARFMNITKTGQGDIDRLGATIVDLGNNSATTEQDIMNMAMRIAGTGSSLGMSAQEVLAMATSLSSMGIQAEMGGNAISTIMRKIDSDVAKNTGTLSVWAETANMGVDEFCQLWGSDAAAAMAEVFKGMGRVQDEGGNLTLLLDDMNVSYMRQVDTMMRSAQAGEMYGEYVTRANAAWSENTALVREVSQRYDTAEAKMQMMKNAAHVMAVTFGEELLPEFSDVVVGAQEFTTWLADLDSDTRSTIVGVAEFVVAFGLLTKAVQLGTGAAGTWMSAYASAKTALTGWAESIHALASAKQASVIADQGWAFAAKSSAASQAANTVSTVANTAAQTANAASSTAMAAEKGILTAAVTANTGAQAANTAVSGAAAAQTGILASSVMGLAAAFGISNAAAMGLIGVIGLLAAGGIAASIIMFDQSAASQRNCTAATRELSAAVDAAQADYDRAVRSFGEHSDAAAKAKFALDEATDAYESGRESVEEYCDSLDDLHDKYAQSAEGMDTAQAEADARAGALLTIGERIADTYEAMDAGAEKSAAIISLIDALSEEVGDLGIGYDAATDSLMINNEAMQDYRATLDEVVSAEADRARYEAASSGYSESLKNQVSIEMELAEANRELEEATKRAEAAQQAHNVSMADARSGIASVSYEEHESAENKKAIEERVEQLNADLADSKNRQAEYLDIMAQLQTKELAVAEAIRMHEDGGISLAEAVEQVNARTSEAITLEDAEAQMALESAEAAVEQAEADKELAEEAQKVADGLSSLMARNSTFAKFMADGGISVESLAAAMQDAGTTADDIEKRMEEFASKTADGLKQIETVPLHSDEGDFMNADQFKRNLDENYEVASRWGEAVQRLYDRHGDEASQAFIRHLEEMGYEYTPLLEELAGMTDKQWAEIESSFTRNTEAGYSNALIQFEQFASQYTVAADQLSEAMARVGGDGSRQMVEAFAAEVQGMGDAAAPVIQSLASMTSDQLGEVVAAYERGGMDAATAYISSIESGSPEEKMREQMAGVDAAISEGAEQWKATAQAGSEAVMAQIDAARLPLRQAASDMAQEIPSGVSDGQGEAASAADNVSKLIADHLSAAKGDARQAGNSMSGEHFSGGVSSGGAQASSQASAVSSAVASALASAASAAYASGRNMALGYAAGIRSGRSAVTSASRAMASSVPTTANKTGEVRSPSRVMMRQGRYWPEGMALGIRQASWMVEREMRSSVERAQRSARASLGGKWGEIVPDAPAAAAIAVTSMSPSVVASESARADAGDTYYVENNNTYFDGIKLEEGTLSERAFREVRRAAKIRERM
jgi:TP901 family phage tail tape measure protein